jgi:transcription elongation factor GreA
MSDAEVVEVELPAVLKNVRETLNEEKWTRATLGNYSAAQFKELDAVLKECQEARLYEELKNLCDEHLVHTKNSIIALYISGMIALSRQIIDDSAIINLVNIFVDNHKWTIVKYLCEGILEYGESKFALRTLGECYRNEGNEEGIYGIWERLVKVDIEETELVKALGEHYEKLGDLEAAVDYFKKALHRYINKGTYKEVKEIWEKLLGYIPEDLDFFLNVQRKIAKNIDKEKAASLLKGLYEICKKRNDLGNSIAILKIVLEYDDRDNQARREITECYRKNYAGHSQLEDYIRVSSLAQGPRNVREAITDFEKHIAFDRGNFVYHRTWGVGRIAKVQGDDIVIDFAKKRGHSMSLKMAVNALQTLSKTHIWVLKAVWTKGKLHEKVKNDLPWALKTLIRSFDNSCDLKRIKAELVPQVLSGGEWAGWSARAREILKSDPNFGVSPENIDLFTVRDRPISLEEKLYNEFKAEKSFFDRAATIREFVSRKDVELDSEYFAEMFGYFTGYLKAYSQVSEQVAASYLLVKDMASKFPHLGAGLSLNFNEIFNAIEDLPSLFLCLKDLKLREMFLHHIKLFIPDWADIYVNLFPYALSSGIIHHLESGGHGDKLTAMTVSSFEKFRDFREAVVWLFKNASGEEWYQRANIPYEKQLITLIHILDISYREIENHRDTTENRKINKQVYNILFGDGTLDRFLEDAEGYTILRIYTFVNDVKDLDPSEKIRLKNKILTKFPDFKFLGEEEKKAAVLGLIVTMAKYQEKQKQLAKLIAEDVPANSKEIEFAKSLGDLRENAEYKAALEKQAILNATLAKLSDEIERAQLFDPATINTSRVGFGVKVTLKNSSSGKEESYTLLGPWESDPDHNVISYLSPFGGTLLNREAGERFDFSVNNEKISYEVKKIEAAF